jgi:hypothetical protein
MLDFNINFHWCKSVLVLFVAKMIRSTPGCYIFNPYSSENKKSFDLTDSVISKYFII